MIPIKYYLTDILKNFGCFNSRGRSLSDHLQTPWHLGQPQDELRTGHDQYTLKPKHCPRQVAYIIHLDMQQ